MSSLSPRRDCAHCGCVTVGHQRRCCQAAIDEDHRTWELQFAFERGMVVGAAIIAWAFAVQKMDRRMRQRADYERDDDPGCNEECDECGAPAGEECHAHCEVAIQNARIERGVF